MLPASKSSSKRRITARDVRHRGLYLGRDRRSGGDLFFPLEWLATHLSIIGATGSGKTRLILAIYKQLLHVRDATIVMVNCKGELFSMARDLAILHGAAERLMLLDPCDPDYVLRYNPLQPNGLSVATHAKAVREAIRAAWGQASFDVTPQLARFLYLALVAARELRWTLADAARLLRPDSPLRRSALPLLEDGYVQEALAYFDALRPARQEELAASTLARLEAFVFDPTIQRLLEGSPSLQLGDVLRRRQVLLANFELYRPLRADDVKLLGRLLVNDVLAHVFARPAGERSPVFLFLDEVELFATEDLCAALNLGRELGLHCVLSNQYPSQLKDETMRGMFDAVRNSARTKIVFGGLPIQMLKQDVAPDVLLDQYSPWIIKDELTSLELDPVETTRDSVAHGTTFGSTVGRSLGVERSRTQTHSATENESHGYGSSDSEADGVSDSEGISESEGSGTGLSLSTSQAMRVNDVNDPYSQTETESRTAHAETGRSSTHTSSHVEQHTSSEHHDQGRSLSAGTSVRAGVSASVNYAQQKSRSDSRTTSPFHSYKKQRVVSSRTYLSEEEFLTVGAQQLHAQGTAEFLLKPPARIARWLQAPDQPPPRLDSEVREKAVAQLHADPRYAKTISVRLDSPHVQPALLVAESGADPQVTKSGRRRPRQASPLEDVLGRE